jgi:Icc-related predicted phosphoesterase
MIIDCVADCHGYYPKLEGGDLLIVAGDLTSRDEPIQYGHFAAWFDRQKYRNKILIAGNHDRFFETSGFEKIKDVYEGINAEYLCDSGTEFEGLKIWGSPWSLWFPGINPKCVSFTCKTEEELKEKWDLIPNNTDILITHCPPRGIRDLTKSKKFAGSKTLVDKLLLSNVKLHVFGHIHECGGQDIFHEFGRKYVNASIVNEYYEHVNEPIRVIL